MEVGAEQQGSTRLTYTPFERIKIARPVDRISYIRGACANKTVLDLGALDETAFVKKRNAGSWLHEEIATLATRVVGLDSSDIVPNEGLRTANNAIIHKADILALNDFLVKIEITPQIVVAGELIEHLANPLSFLKSFREIPNLKGAELLLSTPNATAIHNCGIAVINRESTHPDHLCIFSFKTISTLLSRAGYNSWEIIPYYSDFIEMKERNSGVKRRVISAGERAINLLERMFPLLSFGFIVRTTI